MNALILDPLCLERYPIILSFKIPNYHIYTTNDVLSYFELFAKTGRFKNRRKLIEIIEECKNLGLINILEITEMEKTVLVDQNKLKKYFLDSVYRSLIVLESKLSKSYDKVFITDVSSEFEFISKELGVAMFNYNHILYLVQDNKSESEDLRNKIVMLEYEDADWLVSRIFFGIIATLIGVSIYANVEMIFHTINVWGTIILMIFLGVALFIFREKQRLSYGVFEFLSGIAVIIFVFYPDFTLPKNYSADIFIKIIGGLYVMVRGQDNILKSLQGKKLGAWIKRKTGIGDL